jgi:hypothetical protein
LALHGGINRQTEIEDRPFLVIRGDLIKAKGKRLSGGMLLERTTLSLK